MSSELLKLKTGAGNQDKDSYKLRKNYFLENVELIFDLIENHRKSYKEVLAAINKDGIDITYNYFRRLMSAEKKRRLGSPAVSIKSVHSTPEPSLLPKKLGSELDLTQQEIAIKEEVESIMSSRMSIQQKREAVAKATAPLNKVNPLSRR